MVRERGEVARLEGRAEPADEAARGDLASAREEAYGEDARPEQRGGDGRGDERRNAPLPEEPDGGEEGRGAEEQEAGPRAGGLERDGRGEKARERGRAARPVRRGAAPDERGEEQRDEEADPDAERVRVGERGGPSLHPGPWRKQRVERPEAVDGRHEEGRRAAGARPEKEPVAPVGVEREAREGVQREEKEDEPEERERRVARALGRRHPEDVHDERVDAAVQEEIERLAANRGRERGAAREDEKCRRERDELRGQEGGLAARQAPRERAPEGGEGDRGQ